MSHGSGSVVLQFPSHLNVADKKWHRLEVRTNGQAVRFTLDRCSAAVLSEIEGVGRWLSTEDRTDCEVLGSVPRTARYLNVNHVLQLGGVKESIPYSYPQLLHKHFSGCLRNFILDTQVYDLQSPAESLNSFPGCSLTDGSCETMGSSSCGAHGRCLGDWGSFACHCLPGYHGYRCDKVAQEYRFEAGSHIRYQLPVSVPARRTLLQALVRTRQRDGVIASVLSRARDEHITLQVVQGLLVVSYNLGDGNYSVSLPSYHIDNGEWHHVTLERNENEFTLRLYEGGGKREITKAAGIYKEIVIDPSSLVLGNTYPFSQNRSFQGCMKDVRFNNYRIPLDTHGKELVSVLSAQGIKEGCSSEACRNNPCNQEFICIDLWMMHECSCPAGHMILENASGRQCVYTACAERPCNDGTCVSLSPSTFQCHCPDGYSGRHCEVTLAIFHKDTGLSFTSLFAICVCFLALLALLSTAFLCAHWRTRKALHGGVYPGSAHPEDLEDIRENILNYNEEGGGEQDEDAYNMAELQVSIQGSPAYSAHRRKEPPAAVRARRGPAGGAALGRALPALLREAESRAPGPPQDSLRVFCTEGAGSSAGSLSSLSSLSSAGLGGGAGEDIHEWGPKFEKLRELYSHREAGDL